MLLNLRGYLTSVFYNLFFDIHIVMIIPIIILMFFILMCFLLVMYIIYSIYSMIINYFFRKTNDVISYNVLLKNYIQNVSKNNYFMNYGLWDDKINDLAEANKNLIDFVFKKIDLTDKPNLDILDVGCGYGEQDIELLKRLDKSCKITAVDISEEQIYYAMKKNSDVDFDICDATYIDLKYKNKLFDRIISLESAFHYLKRDLFFKNVNKLLKDNGKFIITDIMLNNLYPESIINKIFVYFFSQVLCIPEQNLITSNEWDNQLSSELNVEESIDITEQTFNPYYRHFMTNYFKNNNCPDWIGNLLSTFFCSNQPFVYKVVVCTKKMSNIDVTN